MQGRFRSDELEQINYETVARQSLKSDALLKEFPNANCKTQALMTEHSNSKTCWLGTGTFVCATSKEAGGTLRLTSCRSLRRGDRLLQTTKLWEAGRITSAAMSLFDPITVSDFSQGFVNGALGTNNPVYEI